MAVHLDIRPRLTFPAEPRVPARRRWRLPPLAVPAVGYWLAMGALTYGFTRLGPHPLDDVQAAAFPAPAIPPHPESQREVEAAPPETPPPEAPPSVAPEPEPEPATQPPEMAPLAASSSDEERREESSAKKREAPSSSGEREEAPRAHPEEPAPRLSFPEFTDSSPAPKREHAADGPRIASLFDPAQTQDRPGASPKPDTPPPPVNDPDAPTVLTSCEAAIARNNEQLTIGGPRAAPDITREAYASILQNGRYLQACSIPERTVFEICAAVKDGHAVGITIVSNPASPALNSCVRRAVARLKFPQNSRLDVTHTRFDAVSR